ncbi:MAG TPA: FHA domain-containing protein [Pseudomonadota bacterium]|nr:FHA domain-containing protein [Rhodanobacteraceae bacterium]MBP9154750.1 FHA domain-containing protein [Xanthomonadales bacterium]HQW82148.1 FHA domain-containing protein [Pseudomonadota bacterium]
MRLHFPHGEQTDVMLREGETSLGSAASNAVVVNGEGVCPIHASLLFDRRGLTLIVREGAESTHLNARPVREKAIVRVGDLLSLGNVLIAVKPDSDQYITSRIPPTSSPEEPMSEQNNETRYRMAPPKAVLRGVSGPYFGKVIAIAGRLSIGRGNDCDLVLDEPEMSRRHAMVEATPAGIWLRDLGSANGTYVNGVQVRDAVLFTGDQLAFDRNRFLIEAPGTPTRPLGLDVQDISAKPRVEVTQTLQAIRLDAEQSYKTDKVAEAATAKPGSPWLLIVVGALIAVAVAALLSSGR